MRPTVIWMQFGGGSYRVGLEPAERARIARDCAEAIEYKHPFGGYVSLEGEELTTRIAEIEAALAKLAAPRDVVLAPYAIASRAVTGLDLDVYCKATGRVVRRWYDKRERTKPVLVSYDDARAYAAWAGARLPTGDEWERAVRGDERRLENAWFEKYDWGTENEWTTDGATCLGVEDVNLCPALARTFDTPRFCAFRLARDHDVVGEALLAAVVADPTSDAPRSVYADHLLSRGDPRGELIALQLARGNGGVTPREAELLATHLAVWLSPIYEALVPSSIRVERGFLTACRVIAGVSAPPHPLWATVTELECADASLIADPCMRSLRSLAAPPGVLAALADGDRPLAIEAIVGPMEASRRTGIRFEGFESEWRRVFALGKLSKLRAVTLWTQRTPTDPAIQELLASPLGRQLERIAIYTEQPYRLAEWRPALQGNAALCEVSLVSGDDRVVLRRDA